MTLNKDLFGKIPITEVKDPVTTKVEMGPTQYSYRRKPQQLAMFMRPHEIKALVSDSVDRMRNTTQSLDFQRDMHKNWLEESGHTEHDYPFVPYPEQTMDELWAQKEQESGYIVRSLKETGGKIHRPVTIQTVDWDSRGRRDPHIREFHMGQGHHRVAGAHYYEKLTGNPVYIPVVHDTDWGHGDDLPYERPENDYERWQG